MWLKTPLCFFEGEDQPKRMVNRRLSGIVQRPPRASAAQGNGGPFDSETAGEMRRLG